MANQDDFSPQSDCSGFGDTNFSLAVYIANKPNLHEYQQLESITPLVKGEINMINQTCGNGWRKVFNVYAKVIYALDKELFSFSEKAATWQLYRDNCLLQKGSETALVFNEPGSLNLRNDNQSIHIICGRTYAKSLVRRNNLLVNLTWLDEEFAIDKENRLVVCPYFDYRQLSNVKIERLSKLVTKIINW